MLSRIAESLYWIGRYLERAEDTARLLDVHLQLAVEDPTIDPRWAEHLLLRVMGVPQAADDPDGPDADDQVLRLLCHDPDSPSSIVAALHGARESARRSRETVSIEMWEGINTTWHEVAAGALAARRPAAAFRWVRERCAVITATADGTMTHDQGWNFLVLGRSLERVDMTARLVEAAALRGGLAAWTSALRAGGAHHAFVRSHHDQDSVPDAAEFLLMNRAFPRSIVHSLDAAIGALDDLDASNHRGLVESGPARVLGRARAELEYRSSPQLLVELPQRMSQLQATCGAADRAIAALYFDGAIATQWHGGHAS